MFEIEIKVYIYLKKDAIFFFEKLPDQLTVTSQLKSSQEYFSLNAICFFTCQRLVKLKHREM